MKSSAISVLLILCCFLSHGQKFVSEKSSVTFFSDAAVEDIKALNTKSNGNFNIDNGEIEFVIPVKEFKFSKSLMQKHFNEKYLETEKFPQSDFKGEIRNYKTEISGKQDVRAVGKLTIHGVTKAVDIPGIMEVINGKIILRTKFIVRLQDYSVTIPQLLYRNITEQVEVTFDVTFVSEKEKE